MFPEVERLLEQATVEELVALTAGHDFWHTVAIRRLGIPAMRVSDGPVGARGTRFDGEASIDAPCSTLLAATWDTDAVEQVGGPRVVDRCWESADSLPTLDEVRAPQHWLSRMGLAGA